MNKKVLIDKVTEYVDCPKSMVKQIIEHTFEEIKDELVKGSAVSIVGFGVFEPRHKQAREGRAPSTQKKIIIPASTHIGFRASQVLKKRVNGID